MEHLWTASWPCEHRVCVWVDGRWQDVKSSATLPHDKHQPGASSDKALIQKIPPSFAENPNEDLKCSVGRRPRGCGYTLPLLALPVIVSLSPHWPSLAGDERDSDSMAGLRTQAPCLHGSMGSQIPQSATNNWGDIKTEEERQNQQKLFTKDPEDKGEGKHPFIPNAFTVQYKKKMENGLGKKKVSYD